MTNLGDTATLAEISRALRNAAAAHDAGAVEWLARLLERRTRERRDELLSRLEALCDQVEAAECARDGVGGDEALSRFLRTLGEYERLVDAIRVHPHLPDSLTTAGTRGGDGDAEP